MLPAPGGADRRIDCDERIDSVPRIDRSTIIGIM